MEFSPNDVSRSPLLLTSLAGAVDLNQPINQSTNQPINILVLCAADSETIYLKHSTSDHRDGVRMKFVDPSIKYHIELAAWGAQAQWPKRCKLGDIALITDIKVNEFRSKRSLKTIHKSKLFVLRQTHTASDDSSSIIAEPKRAQSVIQLVEALQPWWIRARVQEIWTWRDAQSWFIAMCIYNDKDPIRQDSSKPEIEPAERVTHLDDIEQLTCQRVSGRYSLDLAVRSLWLKRISTNSLIPDFRQATLNAIVQVCCSVCSMPLITDDEYIVKVCGRSVECSEAQNIGYEWRPCQVELIDSADRAISLSADGSVTAQLLGGLDAAEVVASVSEQLRNKHLGPLQCHACVEDEYGLCPHFHPMCQLISVLKSLTITDDERSTMRTVIEVKIMTDENAEILDQQLRIVQFM